MRHHATIYTKVWADPDFLALSHSAKGTYMMLVSQPKLSMVGVIDFIPDRWAGYSPDTTAGTITADLAELEVTRFILIDRATFELAIRTMVKNDPPKNPNSAVGMWTAWSHISSPAIKRALLREMPPIMWDGGRAPDEAREMAAHNGSETVGGTVPKPLAERLETQPEVDPLPPTTYHLPPTTSHCAVDRESEPARPPATTMAPSGAATRKPRTPNPLWDALTAEFGEAQTSSEQSLRGRIVKSLTAAGAEPSDIAQRANEHRRRWPNVSCTETSVEKHWTKLAEPEAKPAPAPPQLSKGAQIALDAKARLAQHQRARSNVIDLPAVGSGT